MIIDVDALRSRTLDDFDEIVKLLQENIDFLEETGSDFRMELADRLYILKVDLSVLASVNSGSQKDVLGDRKLLSLRTN